MTQEDAPMSTTTTPTTPDVAPWLRRVPPSEREAADKARKAARQRKAELTYMTEEERDAFFAEEAAAAAAEARAEHLRAQAAMRWALWCREVPEHYVDPRADGARYDEQPAEWWLARLDADQHPARIAAWLKSDSPTLVLFGSTGNGKTQAAICAGYAAAAQATHTRFLTQLDYLRQLRPNGSDRPDLVRWNAANTSLLIFDDLGAETEDGTTFTRQEIGGMIDERLRNNRRQIITTNLSAKPLGNAFGDRIVSRLRDRAVVLHFQGSDRRQALRPSW